MSGNTPETELADSDTLQEIQALLNRYKDLQPRAYIYYDRYSLKQKKKLTDKVRITFDKNLRYRGANVTFDFGTDGHSLLDENQLIMEIKASADKPEWLHDILQKHGLIQMKFSKYACAYHRINGLPYQPKPKERKENNHVTL